MKSQRWAQRSTELNPWFPFMTGFVRKITWQKVSAGDVLFFHQITKIESGSLGFFSTSMVFPFLKILKTKSGGCHNLGFDSEISVDHRVKNSLVGWLTDLHQVSHRNSLWMVVDVGNLYHVREVISSLAITGEFLLRSLKAGKWKVIFRPSIFKAYVNFRGCNFQDNFAETRIQHEWSK